MYLSLHSAKNLGFIALFAFFSCQNNPPEGTKPTVKAPPADALFKLLPAETTGVTFSNEFQESEKVNVFTYGHLYNGPRSAQSSANWNASVRSGSVGFSGFTPKPK